MANDGKLSLLEQEHENMKNPFGNPVVGWLPTSQGVGGIHNPKGWALLRTVVHKMVDGILRALYDQPTIVENVGSIVICQLGDRVGMAQNYRMVGERLLPHAGALYIQRLQSEKRWEELLSKLGRWSWEAPKGLAPGETQEDLEDFILRTAKLEALEEAGFTLRDARIVGRVNANPTFFAHSQYIVHAHIESVGNSKPEDLEIIAGRKFFTMDELRELNNRGEFDDGLTLAGLALCGMHL